MRPVSPDILNTIAAWPQSAQQHLLSARAIVFESAETASTGPLSESLKWGQPAWRPSRPRTGSTLRLNWSPDRLGQLLAYVDCKTDLASQMSTRFPHQFGNDGRRSLAFDLNMPLPQDAVAQLAHLTFTYHRQKSPR